MIGGIIIATLLTLLFLPALYVAWYKIKEPSEEERQKAERNKQVRNADNERDQGRADERPTPAQ
jgi:predicted RND superfamily exporter protein